jgi:cysteine desulfurase
LKLADSLREKERARVAELQQYFIKNLEKMYPSGEVVINGDCNKRLPNSVNIGIGIPGKDAEFTVIQLDAAGIACSAGSACTNLSAATYSYVIEAVNPIYKSSSIRCSFGRATSKRELELTLRALRSIISS